MFHRPKTELTISLTRNGDGRPRIVIDTVDPGKTPPARRIFAHLKKQFKARETGRLIDPITDAGMVDLMVEDRALVFEIVDLSGIAIYARNDDADDLLGRVAESVKQEFT